MPSVVAVSSGHGKYVKGAVPPYMDEVTEARRVVAQLATELKAVGATVRGPFNDDVSKTQQENLNRIVTWHNSQNRELDVSVHFNCNAQTSSPMGTECLYKTQDDLAADVSKAVSDASKLKNRGAKYRGDLAFLNGTAKPAILIEVCFVDSSADRDLYNANFQPLCAAIAQAITGKVAPPGPTPPPGPEVARPDVKQGDTGPYVVSVQETLGLPPDGDFGSITDAGVKGFQRAWAVPGGADGWVGDNTWKALDDLDERNANGDDGISRALETQIEQIVRGSSSVLNYVWKNRGKANEGYIAGMAKTFALALMRLNNDDEAAGIMAHADNNNPDKDALSWYASEFRAKNMDNSKSGANTLRHLFVMMTGLGMCESSGNHWEGRDMSASNTTSDTCEAGLFQASWNLSSCSSEITNLFNEFKGDPNGFRPTFTKGLYPNTGNLDNYGSGNGCYYQWLAKYCPAFSALMTGVGMRKLRQHWGPINRREVEIVSSVDAMLKNVEDATMQATPGEV